MPVISKQTIRLKTGNDFIRVIKYAKGVFTIDLPKELCEDLVLKNSYVSANTEIAACAIFVSKLKEWETAITTTDKVLFFDAKFQGALAKKSFESRWEKGYTPSYKEGHIHDDSSLWEFNAQDISRFESDRYELGLTFKWAVYNKIMIKDNNRYKFISGRPFDNPDEETYVCIPWTAEREQFFLSLDQSFAEMIAKVYQALGDLTPKKLMQLSDSGLKLIGK